MKTTGDAVVTDINTAAIRRFERCVEKLETITERSGIPASALSNHPAVRPIIKEMQSLLLRINVDGGDFGKDSLVLPERDRSNSQVTAAV